MLSTIASEVWAASKEESLRGVCKCRCGGVFRCLFVGSEPKLLDIHNQPVNEGSESEAAVAERKREEKKRAIEGTTRRLALEEAERKASEREARRAASLEQVC